MSPDPDDTTPTVLFLCTHNAGRSQMALGFFTHLAGDRAIGWSGGSEPGTEINPAAIAAMNEAGIDITGEFPKPWTDEIVRAADVVITMGCGDACPIFPGKRYENWELPDPAGQSVEAVRPIRDEIRNRVQALLAEIAPAGAPHQRDPDAIRAAVRDRYAAAAQAASCCGPASCGPADPSIGEVFGQSQYPGDQRADLPEAALQASLGCGNPTALAELRPGDVVLDLGSGGGIDVLLSARRVAPGGKAYGLDMTPEMLALANANKAEAGVTNAEFLLGSIEDVPLPDGAVDVIISNCVVNLSPDKDRVFRESFRVLTPGGRFAISDVVLARELPREIASITALWTGCIAGALTEDEVVAGLAAAGFDDISVEPTNVFGRAELESLAAALSPEDVPAGVDIATAIDGIDGVIRSAFIRATKPR